MTMRARQRSPMWHAALVSLAETDSTEMVWCAPRRTVNERGASCRGTVVATGCGVAIASVVGAPLGAASSFGPQPATAKAAANGACRATISWGRLGFTVVAWIA